MLALQGKIFDLLEKGRDDSAIKILYNEVFPKVKKYIRQHGGTREDAEDAFQEGMSIFYKQWHLGKLDSSKDVESYIFIISRNVWLNMLNKNKKTLPDLYEHTHVASDEDILSSMITTERNQYITKLLDALGKKCKELLTYTIFYKKSMQEVVSEMGYANENAAKSTNYRCKQKLIALIEGKAELTNLIKNE